MTVLQIFLPDDWPGGDGLYPWVLRDSRRAMLGSGNAPLCDMPQARAVEVVAPASRVLLTSVKLPARSRNRLQKLLPYAVEEKVMADPEGLHVAAGPILPNGEIAVAVVDKAWINQALQLLRGGGIRPRRVWVETLLPTIHGDDWTVVLNGDKGFVRTGAFSGLPLDGGSQTTPPLVLVLAARQAQAGLPGKIKLLYADLPYHPDLAQWSEKLGIEVEAGERWEWWSEPAGPGIDLLQGEFAPAVTADWLPKLRPAAVLAGLIVLSQLSFGVAEWWSLSREKNRLQTELETSFRAAFPEARAVVDPRLQMRRNLRELRHARGLADSGDFLPLLARLTPLLGEAGPVRLRALQYQQGILKLELQLDNRQAADKLRDGLRAMEAQLEIVETQAGNVVARVTLAG